MKPHLVGKPNWPNPYKVIYVPIEELAECHMGLNQPCRDVDGSTFLLTKEKILEHWHGRERTTAKLDAYILPQPSGWHDIGVRYGAEDHEYLSPAGDKEKVAALLKRYL